MILKKLLFSCYDFLLLGILIIFLCLGYVAYGLLAVVLKIKRAVI